jgi:lysophospholipase L1-like esterase
MKERGFVMTILFQGDSITDCGRRVSGGEGYEVGEMGPGYPGLIKSRLSCDHPNRDFTFLNRAISGNRIVDLYARWRCDAINLRPDLLSILIGVNDSWHEASGNGVEVPRAERIYRELLAWTKEKLPQVRLVLIEPFTGPFAAGAPLAGEVALRAAFTCRLAEEFGAVFIPMQSIFDAAFRHSKPEHWMVDGVHLTPAGHQLLADAWLDAVKL